MKQKNIPWLGAFLETFFTTIPFINILSLCAILLILYTNIRPYLLRYTPWMTLWLFMAIVVVVGITGMVLVYKFVMMSIWSFRGKQMDSRNDKKGVVVAVSGGFDPINGKGHITHIREARKLGDSVVLILSRDDQLIAKSNKPNGTFYPDYTERLFIMSEMRSVDKVVMNIDTDGTCAETLRMVRPQILAKGGDRNPLTMPIKEIEVCREIGCRIVYNVGDEKKTSSSELIRRARNETQIQSSLR